MVVREEQSGACTMERSRTGYLTAVSGERGLRPTVDHVIIQWSQQDGVNWLEFKQMQTQPPNKLPGCGITLNLGNDGSLICRMVSFLD